MVGENEALAVETRSIVGEAVCEKEALVVIRVIRVIGVVGVVRVKGMGEQEDEPTKREDQHNEGIRSEGASQLKDQHNKQSTKYLVSIGLDCVCDRVSIAEFVRDRGLSPVGENPQI
jgi:hypothetical protein